MRLGLDLGGTKTAAIVLDDAGHAVWEHRKPTPRNDYDATIELIAGLVDEGERAAASRCSIGIGMPGAVSPATGLVKNANSTWLNGRTLRQDIERRLGREVRLANDANCLAMSEATDGAAAGAEVVFGVILGTGTGGGIVVRGQLVNGANAIAGEWGHNPLPSPEDDERPGPQCYCGRRGCLETFLSGPALSAAYRERAGRTESGETVVALAAGGDEVARAVLDRWTVRLARSLASVINVLDPQVIVVGGGLSRLDHIYSRVPEIWGAWVFSDRVATRLVQARFGDASGVRGAAWLWPAMLLSP
jgi:fructokinase